MGSHHSHNRNKINVSLSLSLSLSFCAPLCFCVSLKSIALNISLYSLVIFWSFWLSSIYIYTHTHLHTLKSHNSAFSSANINMPFDADRHGFLLDIKVELQVQLIMMFTFPSIALSNFNLGNFQ